ncbi:MAG: flagellar hook-basal body complex protein FliE [Clostridia bacterium]|nr:flagellar hook-basal body complex protein FliE [Clostridia bacterium]
MDSIKAIQQLSNIIKSGASNQNVSSVDFKELLIDSLEKVNQDQLYADEMDEALVLGETDNIHEVMIASQKAEVSLTFAVEVRNKILEAYKELMRIQM